MTIDPNIPDPSEVLLSRVIDGEAGSGDLAALGEAMARDPGLLEHWARLQRDDRRLAMIVEQEVERATQAAGAEILATSADTGPVHADSRVSSSATGSPQERAPVLHIPRPAISYLGWAAAIVLALIIVVIGRPTRPAEALIREVNLRAVEPHILEERTLDILPPVTLYTESMPDGRTKWRWMHREIREVITDHFEPGWVIERRAEPEIASH